MLSDVGIGLSWVGANVDMVGLDGKRPLEIAIEQQFEEIVYQLISYEAEILEADAQNIVLEGLMTTVNQVNLVINHMYGPENFKPYSEESWVNYMQNLDSDTCMATLSALFDYRAFLEC